MTLQRYIPALTGFVSIAFLAACGGPDAPEPTEPTVAAPETPAAETPAETTLAESATEEAAEVASSDHAHEDHHDEHGAEHGGAGETHQHGHAQAAVILENNGLTISITGALASFGASEAEPQTPEEHADRDLTRTALLRPDSMIGLPDAARCIFGGSDVMFRYADGQHGNAEASYTWQCSAAGELDAVTFRAFQSFQTLEEVDVVGLVGNSQTAATLTPDNARFDLN